MIPVRLWVVSMSLWLAAEVSVFAVFAPSDQPALELEQISLYVTVLDESGAPVRGLPREAFQIWENGIPQEIDAWRDLSAESGPASPPEERRWLVFSFSSGLDFRELFRAKRAALWLAGKARPGRDLIAVLRDSRLSAFKHDPRSFGYLIRYFGVNDGLRDTEELPPVPTWRLSLESAGDSSLPSIMLANLVSQGAEGRTADLLGSLKHLAGQKLLFHFEAGPADTRPGELKDDFDPLVLGDAGFSLHVVDVSRRRRGRAGPAEKKMEVPRDWASRSGGSVVQLAGGARRTLAGLQERLDSGYWLRYTPGKGKDGRYRSLEVTVASDRPLTLLHRPGFFATSPAVLPLGERTLKTAFESPDQFRDFPVGLSAQLAPPEIASDGTSPPQVRFLLSFPMGAVRLEQSEEGDWTQRVLVFVGIFDVNHQLVGAVQRVLSVKTKEAELDSLLQRTAALDETATLSPDAIPRYLLAAVIVGQNRQITVQRFELE